MLNRYIDLPNKDEFDLACDRVFEALKGHDLDECVDIVQEVLLDLQDQQAIRDGAITKEWAEKTDKEIRKMVDELTRCEGEDEQYYLSNTDQ